MFIKDEMNVKCTSTALMSLEEPFVLVRMSCADYEEIRKLVQQNEMAKIRAREKSRERSGRQVTPRPAYTTPIQMEILETYASYPASTES